MDVAGLFQVLIVSCLRGFPRGQMRAGQRVQASPLPPRFRACCCPVFLAGGQPPRLPLLLAFVTGLLIGGTRAAWGWLRPLSVRRADAAPLSFSENLNLLPLAACVFFAGVQALCMEAMCLRGVLCLRCALGMWFVAFPRSRVPEDSRVMRYTELRPEHIYLCWRNDLMSRKSAPG